MSDDERYLRALELATRMHQGQKRTGGADYITHPIAVSNILKEKGYGIDYQIAGLFHDLLEDTTAKESDIEDIGGAEVLKVVKLLSKQRGYNMDEYVRGIKSNKMACAVKGADRLHNLRCAVVCDDDFKRRYVLETLDYYLDLDERIPQAVRELAESMSEPLYDLPLSYEKINASEE